MKLCPQCEQEYDGPEEVCPADGARLVSLPEDEAASLVGEVVDGRYDVVELIGKGGMGSVYRATQKQIGREVALKVLRKDLADDRTAVRRFFHEAKIVSKLRHPNTVTLFDFGHSSDGLLFIAMEYMTGRSLQEVTEARTLSLNEILEIGSQICGSLTEAHAAGIVHRDLKPGNLFIDKVGGRTLIKVLDFGIAKIMDTGSPLTLTGMVFGTPAYMSPEQAQGHPIDQRSDIYSLGVLLFELICGRLPYPGETAMKLALAHILEPVPDPAEHSRYRPLPSQLRALITAMLCKEPELRPQSADSVADVLIAVRRLLALRKDGQFMPTTQEVRPSSTAATTRPSANPEPMVAVRERISEPENGGAAPGPVDLPKETGPLRLSEIYHTVESRAITLPAKDESTESATRGIVALLCVAAVAVAFVLVGREGGDAEPVVDVELLTPVEAALAAPEEVEAPVETPVTQPPPEAVEALDPVETVESATPGVLAKLRSAFTEWMYEAAFRLGGVAELNSTAATMTSPQITVRFRTRPAGARVSRSGSNQVLCEPTPCEAKIGRGAIPFDVVITRSRYHTARYGLTEERDQTVELRLRRMYERRSAAAGDGEELEEADGEVALEEGAETDLDAAPQEQVPEAREVEIMTPVILDTESD